MARRPRSGTQRGFLKTVQDSIKNMEEKADEVYRDGVLDFYIELRANTPVLTGNLRDAWVVSNAANPEPQGPTGPEGGGALTSGITESLNNIAQIKVGDRVNILNRATYFFRIERGFTGTDSLGRFYNTPGRWFAARVGSKWRGILRAAAAKHRMKMK